MDRIAMQQFILSVMDRFGYLGICFLILLENLFPPIPSEIILPFSGFMTTYTRMKVWGVVFFSTVGSTAGAFLLYWLGSLLRADRLGRFWDGRLCRLLGFRKENVERAMNWFERRGRKAVLFGRCVPIVRSLVSIPAGMAGVRLPVFFVYTVIGSAVWNFLLVSLGALLGASWEAASQWLGRYSLCAKAAMWTLVAVFLIKIAWERRRAGRK